MPPVFVPLPFVTRLLLLIVSSFASSSLGHASLGIRHADVYHVLSLLD